MKNPTLEERINNSVNAFFSDERNFEENKLSYADGASLQKTELEILITEKADTFVKILRAVFIFLPGAFFLYFSSIFFLYAFFVGKTSLLNFGFGFALWTISGTMTVFGIGKIKDLKYLLIPTSICTISFIFFLASLLLPQEMQAKFLFEYSAYLFPLVLVAPYLVKTLIEKK